MVFKAYWRNKHSFIAGLIFSLFSVLTYGRLEAETNLSEIYDRHWLGISAFGIQSKNFQGKICNTFLKTVAASPNPAIAVLYNTFGDDNRCLSRFWERQKAVGKPFVTQFHFSNEAGRRAGSMDTLDFQYDLNIAEYNYLLEKMPKWFESELRLRVIEILELTEGYEDFGTFILSAGLEDNYSTEGWENLYKILKSEWPYAISRNVAFTSAMRKQDWVIPADLILEIHGYTRKLQTQQACIANGDGQDVDFLKSTGLDFRDAKAASEAELMTWLQRAKLKNCITFLWTGKWQGWFNPKKAPPPLERKFQFHSEDIPKISSIMNPTAPIKKGKRTSRRP